MKKFFDEDFTLNEIKKTLKKMQSEKDINTYVITALVVVSILAIVVTVIVAVVKLTKKYDEDIFEDYDDYDEFYVEDEDFDE